MIIYVIFNCLIHAIFFFYYKMFVLLSLSVTFYDNYEIHIYAFLVINIIKTRFLNKMKYNFLMNSLILNIEKETVVKLSAMYRCFS